MSVNKELKLSTMYVTEVFNKPGKLNKKNVENNALEVLKMRYFIDLPNDNKENTFSELCRRVARVVATGVVRDSDQLSLVQNVEENIYNDMMSHRFLFNSPALFSAGVGISSDKEISHLLYDPIITQEDYVYIKNHFNKNQMMFACFTVSVPDSIEGIFDSVKNAAIISKYGGGVGANFGNLREKESLIAGGCGGTASGPISFMETWNTMGAVVVQGGKRRAALMGMLNSSHPDIEEFIDVKTEDGRLSYFNVSVAIDDKFMDSVFNDRDYDLVSPADGKVKKTVKARELWDKICSAAHKRGDPGIFFKDVANKDHLLNGLKEYKIETTNPCLTGDALVSMSDGSKKMIKEIEVGDKVLSYNLKSYEVEEQEVLYSGLTRENANIIEIELEDGRLLKLTPEHKVFTENRGYVEARLLNEDDLILTFDKLDMLIGINVIKNEDVYDIKVNKNNNFFANEILVHNCGEQPLPNESSCNLGSINLAEFVVEGTKNSFNWEDFKQQILRATFYLDLVIDVTQYPLKDIEKRTKAIRPIGLGIMGLADACIKLGIRYGSEEFLKFCKSIGEYMSAYSLIGSVAIAKMYGSFKEWDRVRNTMFLECSTTEDILNCADTPVSFKEAVRSIPSDIRDAVVDEILNSTGIRNSRRLSIAPTGTISLLLNTSSSIEPNFAYEWSRMVNISSSKKKELKYYHRYYSDPTVNKDTLVSAHDLLPIEHIEAVKIFAPFIDSAISKTVNLHKDASVKDVKEIYEYCWRNGIKGITVYRDGSRSEQPLSSTKEIEKLQVGRIKERPKFMTGVTTKCDSPYGSIYLTANFEDTGALFETFISAGKSGSVSKSVTEALSRVISLALRAGVKVEDVIKTIANISGSEVWVYENANGEEVLVKSIPDAVSKMLVDLNRVYSKTQININDYYSETNDEIFIEGELCPECGNKLISMSGCHLCAACGWSPCK
ncbi:MAG TPA: ribonucleotide reductase N-terminal alpha domain-containing protein [Bacilli bacterium]|nr:ribonucleotide reductase N-terminal alpha domain-containing protein [Bacilli bacterium]